MNGTVNRILPESTAFNVQASAFRVRRSAFRARAPDFAPSSETPGGYVGQAVLESGVNGMIVQTLQKRGLRIAATAKRQTLNAERSVGIVRFFYALIRL